MVYYAVVDIGCIECGVSSNVVLLTADKSWAERVAEQCAEKYGWREDGQNIFEVFEVFPEVIKSEYKVQDSPMALDSGTK